MRIVLDTNILVSAGLKERSLPAIVVARVQHRGVLLKSAATERELVEVIARPRIAPLIPPRFRDWLTSVLAAAETVPITERIAACRDPKDDKFLELAVNGRADLIVSGDGDLLVLAEFRRIPIIDVATFARAHLL